MVYFPFYAVNLDDIALSNVWTHCTVLATFLHAPNVSLFIFLLFLYLRPYDILSDILLPLIGNKGGLLKVSDKYLFLDVIERHCFLECSELEAILSHRSLQILGPFVSLSVLLFLGLCLWV